jgi:hypothetical protein
VSELTPEQRRMVESISRMAQTFAVACQPVVHAFADAMKGIHEVIWKAYREAGTPYGDNEDGLLRWLEAIRRQWEHQRS